MIVIDTHIWIWWVAGADKLSRRQMDSIAANEADVIGVSAISCWEVAKLSARGRLELTVSVDTWINTALRYPAVLLLPLTPQIAIASTRLPGEMHNDPAEQIIVATARTYNCALLTQDGKLAAYPHVTTIV